MLKNDSSHVLTVKELSDYLKVHPSTIYRQPKRGRVPGVRGGWGKRGEPPGGAPARTPGVTISRGITDEGDRRGENMRLSIVAGLIMGASLAVHSALGAPARADVRGTGN